eukprot:2849977-Rhodomonas_salina.1
MRRRKEGRREDRKAGRQEGGRRKGGEKGEEREGGRLPEALQSDSGLELWVQLGCYMHFSPWDSTHFLHIASNIMPSATAQKLKQNLSAPNLL